MLDKSCIICQSVRVQQKILGPWQVRLPLALEGWFIRFQLDLFCERECFSITVQARQSTNCDPLGALKTHMLHKRCANYNTVLKWSPGFSHNSSTGSNSLCSVFSNLLKSLSVCSVWPTQSNLYGYSANQSEEETLFIIGGIPSTIFRYCKQCWIDAL